MPSIDVVLVNPSNKKQVYGKLSEKLAGIEPPLWTGLLAAFLREQGFEVRIIDADAEGWGPQETVTKILEYKPVLLGLGAIGSNPSAASTPKMAAIRSVLTLLKDQDTSFKTILYGIHPSALPEQTLQDELADFVCRGESFFPFTELLHLLKSKGEQKEYSIKGLWYRKDGQIVGNGWADLFENLDELPFVAWDLLPMDKYRAHNWHCFGHINRRSPYAIIYTSLGCPYDCTYCNIHALYNGKPKIRYRSPQRVLEEIDYLVKNYNVKIFKFLDELFVIKGRRCEEICDMLAERNYDLNIWAYARVDTVNETILKKLKKAGVHWLCYGFEAGSKKVRDGVSKGRFDQEAIRRAVKMTYDAGIHIIGNFMFGLPDDDRETMQETLDLAKELNCEYVNFYSTMAYPGSRLYEEAVAQGLPLPDNWVGFSQFSFDTKPLPTKHISGAEVLAFRDKAFNEYYSNSKYLKMIEEKFGQETVDHIRKMLQYTMKRKIIPSC